MATTTKYDFEKHTYSTTELNSILDTNIEKLDDYVHTYIEGTAGEALSQYDAVYLKSDGKFWKAQADGTKQPCLGIAIEAASADATVRIQRIGDITNAGWSWSTVGGKVYLDASTAGDLTETAPSENAQVVGIVLSATELWLAGSISAPAYETGSADGQLFFWDDSNGRLAHTETSEIFWDDTNKRLGIGTATPATELEVDGDINVTNDTDLIGGIQKQNLLDKSASETVSGEYTFSTFPITPSAAPDADYEVANKKYVDDNVGGGSSNAEDGTATGQVLYWDNTAGEWKHTETSELVWDDTNKRLGIGTASPARTLEVLDSSNAQVRLTHTDGTHYAEIRVDSNGYVIHEPTGGVMKLNIENNTSVRGLIVTNSVNSVLDAPVLFQKSRGSISSPTIVQNNDVLGTFLFRGYDGSDYIQNGAYIRAQVDGTPGTNSIPGELIFATTTDGETSSSVRMTIRNNGHVGIGTTDPDRLLDVLDDTNPQIRGTHTDGTNYFELQANGSGYVKIITSGGGYGIDVAPTAVQTGYTTPSNLTTDRTFDADSTTVAELADVLGTLIEDLKAKGIISA